MGENISFNELGCKDLPVLPAVAHFSLAYFGKFGSDLCPLSAEYLAFRFKLAFFDCKARCAHRFERKLVRPENNPHNDLGRARWPASETCSARRHAWHRWSPTRGYNASCRRDKAQMESMPPKMN